MWDDNVMECIQRASNEISTKQEVWEHDQYCTKIDCALESLYQDVSVRMCTRRRKCQHTLVPAKFAHILERCYAQSVCRWPGLIEVLIREVYIAIKTTHFDTKSL
jgi:hypothetical protein